MPSVSSGVVRGQDGWCGTVLPPAPHASSDSTHVHVQLASGEQCLVPAAVVLPQQDGSLYVPLRRAELVPAPRGDHAEPRHAVVPVLGEELEVQKRVIETGKVRITTQVHEREALVDEPLWREEVEVTRVPIQRVVDAPIPMREEHDTLIVPVLEEVLVVEKRLMLKEEIHMRTHRVETRQPQQVTLRREEVSVERVPNPDTSAIIHEGG
jgi:uncharacterized protein (TIGR02271 family)